MKIIKINKKNNNLYQIILSDNTSLSFYDDTIIHFNLLINKDIDSQKLKLINDYNAQVIAYYKALAFLKAKLRTKKEIYEKLKTLGCSTEIINNVVNRLEKERYLDDSLYIRSYIDYQINLSTKGPKKIQYELVKKGFENNKILPYLESYETELWINKANKIIAKKIKANHNLSKNVLIKKLKQDLVNLGYEPNLINNLLQDIDILEDENIIQKEIVKAKKRYQKKYIGLELEKKVKQYMYNKGFTDFDKLDKYL